MSIINITIFIKKFSTKSYLFVALRQGFAAIYEEHECSLYFQRKTEPENVVGNNLQSRCTSQFQNNHSSEEIQEKTNEENQQNNSECTHPCLTAKASVSQVFLMSNGAFLFLLGNVF